MIVSASRRTDIPAFYSEWFMNRIKDRYVLVRNPMNGRKISRIDLSPSVVDGIVFCTKNPAPMLDKLDLLSDYMYYFQLTLTSYGSDVEPCVPSKNDVVIPAFQRLAEKLGPDRVIWRYDPIFLSDTYTMDYHIEYFDKLADKLKGYTNRCTISFIDSYRHTQKSMQALKLRELTPEGMDLLARHLSGSAHRSGMNIDTCAESIDLEKYDISHARCIDDKLFEKLLGCSLTVEKAKSQRPHCGCAASVDIGAYNTCRFGCRYCYATYSSDTVTKNCKNDDPNSPVLCGRISADEKVSDRAVESNKNSQFSLFD